MSLLEIKFKVNSRFIPKAVFKLKQPTYLLWYNVALLQIKASICL